MSYAKALAAYLTDRKQTDFAVAAGLTQASVSRYANGERFPQRDAAMKIDAASDGAVPFALWCEEAARRIGLEAA